jgi:hypothetical protein
VQEDKYPRWTTIEASLFNTVPSGTTKYVAILGVRSRGFADIELTAAIVHKYWNELYDYDDTRDRQRFARAEQSLYSYLQSWLLHAIKAGTGLSCILSQASRMFLPGELAGIPDLSSDRLGYPPEIHADSLELYSLSGCFASKDMAERALSSIYFLRPDGTKNRLQARVSKSAKPLVNITRAIMEKGNIRKTLLGRRL